MMLERYLREIIMLRSHTPIRSIVKYACANEYRQHVIVEAYREIEFSMLSLRTINMSIRDDLTLISGIIPHRV